VGRRSHAGWRPTTCLYCAPLAGVLESLPSRLSLKRVVPMKGALKRDDLWPSAGTSRLGAPLRSSGEDGSLGDIGTLVSGWFSRRLRGGRINTGHPPRAL